VSVVSAVVLHAGLRQPDATRTMVQTLLQQAWSAVTLLSHDALIVASPMQPDRGFDASVPPGARLVVDDHPQLWPAGALHAGLSAAEGERSLVVTGDMPLLNLPLLRYMVLLSPDYDAVMVRLAGKPEPLHAVYARACIPSLQSAIATANAQTLAALAGLRVRYVDDSEVETFDPEHLSVFRVQSMADWEWLQRGTRHRQTAA